MKKRCVRRFCGFLASALLISLLTATALAVNKIVLSDGTAAPATVLAGHTYALKVSDNTKVNFYSNNEAVAAIGKTTGRFEPIAPGKVTITAKDAKTDEKVVATRTFTVLQRAAAVRVGAETLYLSQGDQYTLKPMLTPTTSTDVIRFSSGDKAVATVGQTSGTVTAKAPGETTITIYAKEKATISNADAENQTATVRVVVREKSLKAEVLEEKQIKLTFSENVSSVTAENFSVTQTNTLGASRTLGIESVVQNSGSEILLTLAEPVFSTTETSTATLYFTSPDDENHMIVVDLGKKYADTSELKSITKSGNERIEAGTGSFLQFWGADKDGASYPLDNVTVCLYSYVTNTWTDLPKTGAVVDKVSFRCKLLSDGSLVVTYAAPPDAGGTTFAIQLKKENGSSFPATALFVTSAGERAKYSLRFVSSDGEELFEPLTVSAGTYCTAPKPARENYTFVKWVRSDELEDFGRILMPEYDLTLTAVWEYTPSELTPSVSTGGWVYGSPVSPALNNGPTDALAVAYQYRALGADDTEWSEAIPADAGAYQVRAVITPAEGGTVTTAAADFTVSPKEVTILGTTAAPSKTYDGSSSAEITDEGILSGVIDGDDLYIVPGTAAYDDETVGTGKTVTFTDFAITGEDKDNYVLAAQPASVTADILAPADVISVDIAWEPMEFTYSEKSDGTWNPETHRYEGVTAGGWAAKSGTDPKITVTNRSGAEVGVVFDYVSAEGVSGIYGGFAPNGLVLPGAEGENAPTAQTSFSLSGSAITESKSTVGTITVKVLKAVAVSDEQELRDTGINTKSVFVRLTDDIELQKSLSAINYSSILDLNGHTLSVAEGATTVLYARKLTIRNGTLKVKPQQDAYSLRASNEGVVTVENCTLIGGTVWNIFAHGKTLYLKDCTLDCTSSEYGSYFSTDAVFSGTTRIIGNQYLDLYNGAKVVCLAGTYNFDPAEYVDTNAFNITSDGSVWTVTAK